jgi:four helix bundle protein
MSGVRRFQDLVAWQKARLLTRAIYIQTQEPKFARDWELTNQMRRAAVSVMSTIAEGFDRQRPAEFRHYLTIAKASCAELCSQLHVAFDVGYVDETLFQQLLAQTEEVSRILGGLRNSIH